MIILTRLKGAPLSKPPPPKDPKLRPPKLDGEESAPLVLQEHKLGNSFNAKRDESLGVQTDLAQRKCSGKLGISFHPGKLETFRN